jgi:hypothetical protein
METVSEIIEALGGATAVAVYLSEKAPDAFPVERQTVSNWKIRESIPGEYWYEIVVMARHKRVSGIHYDFLARLHSRLPTVSNAA